MAPQRRSVDLPNGDVFEWFMTPVTLASVIVQPPVLVRSQKMS